MHDEGPHGASFGLGPITGEPGVDDLQFYHALGLRPDNFHVQDEDLESIDSPDSYPSFGPVFVGMAWNERHSFDVPIL